MLYKGNKKFKTLRRGNQVITRLFKGDELIFKDVEALYGFKFTIDTTMTAGGTHGNNRTFLLQTTGSSAGPDASLTVQWGDGTSDVWVTRNNNNNLYHTYTTAGTYQVTITPNTFVGSEPIPGWLSRVSTYEGYKIISIDKKYPDNSFIAERGNTAPTDHVVTTDVKGFFSFLYNITSLPAGFLDNISIRENPHTTSLDSFFANTFAYFGENTGLMLDDYLVNWLDGLEFSEVTNFSYMFDRTFCSAKVSEAAVQRFISPLRTPAGTNFSGMFSFTFGDEQNRGHSWDTLPADFFPPLDTSNGTDFSNMFYATFHSMAKDSTTATIPAGLFDFLDTSNGTNFNYMFQSTFYSFAPNSTNCNIPAGLFDSLNTSNGTTFRSMFSSTFCGCCQKNPSAAIPTGLFDFLDTSNGTEFRDIFRSTFSGCFTKSNVANIPAGLFDHLDISGATNASGMFAYTFSQMVDNGTYTSDFIIPANLFSVLDFSHCINFSDCFSSTFDGIHVSGINYRVVVPENLFTIDTANGVNFSNMFYNTFGYISGSSWSPTSIFNLTSTSNGTNFSGMFGRTFFQIHIEIPAGLFSHINTSNGTNLSGMFAETFWASYGTQIPATLFSGIDTTSATDTSRMFYSTFKWFQNGTTPVTIPATLFSSIDVSDVSNVSSMFERTFEDTYCQIYPEGLFGGIDLSPIGGVEKNVNNIFFCTFDMSKGNNTWELKDVFLGMPDFSWATAANANKTLGNMFKYSNNNDNTTGSANTILQHFNFTPNSRTQMFANRTGLTDYATINTNWK